MEVIWKVIFAVNTVKSIEISFLVLVAVDIDHTNGATIE